MDGVEYFGTWCDILCLPTGINPGLTQTVKTPERYLVSCEFYNDTDKSIYFNIIF